MFKILILSNGHGEDLSGSLIAKQFVKSGYSVDALPIVGIGSHYEKEKLRLSVKPKNLVLEELGIILLREDSLRYLEEKYFIF